MMPNLELIRILNEYGQKRIPVFFLISFDKSEFEVHPLDSLPDEIQFAFNEKQAASESFELMKYPVAFEAYQNALEKVQEEIRCGNTYLLNYTCSTPIETPIDLEMIYKRAGAPYKFYWQDKYVCFSPECFVNIRENTIRTFPMKGTIDASLPNAEETILADSKEYAEHVMVVDLLRNDLGIVAKEIKVARFRYVERINTGKSELLQVSSEITGKLEENWQERLGDILDALLPAGSISGTPKKKTCEIIQQLETHKRGYFTGIFGTFDGQNLESAVAIRFIEQNEHGLVYKSGGGITIDSRAESEYAEMQQKIYVPVS